MNDLQELLKDLKDIHEPEAISVWPLAIGWWLLPIFVTLLLVLIIWWWKRKRVPDYKKIALQDLKNIVTDYQIQRNAHKSAGEITLLIRKSMVARYGNQKVASMIGDEWLYQLDEISRTTLFSSGAGKVILSAPYARQLDPDLNIVELFDATKKLLGRL